MDLLNAIHALSLAVRLVTNNTRKFQRVPGLRLENWVWRRRQGRHSTPRKPLRCKGKLRFEKWERANIILQDVTPYYAFRQHRRRRKRYGSGPRASRMTGRVSLADRPAIVHRRGRVGDWEGDTVVGRGQTGFLATHVDRRSRFLLAAKVSRRTAAEVTAATQRILHPLPRHVRRTLTVDNGSEWTAFRTLQATLGLRVYFASPYAAWERGTNENTNGLLRDYFPKPTDFSTITKPQLAQAVEELNNRPRKCLAYHTPAEVFARAAGVALQP
jgi:transposase, IS30 family